MVMLYGRWLQSMVASIQSRIHHKLNQFKVESTANRIQPTVAKSKKVKNPAKRRTFTLYYAKVLCSDRIPGLARASPVGALRGSIYARAGWKLEAGLKAG